MGARVKVNETEYEVSVDGSHVLVNNKKNTLEQKEKVIWNGKVYHVTYFEDYIIINGRPYLTERLPWQENNENKNEITSPLTGRVTSVQIKVGQRVEKGQVLCIIEAMKMENSITSTKTATIKEVLVKQNEVVQQKQVLFKTAETP